MKDADRTKFAELLTGISEIYGKPISRVSMQLWFDALKDYEIDEIASALSRHVRNPDTGKWIPKPADVIAAIDGTAADAAYLAWTKVEEAIQRVGSYETVVFDDPIIHCVVQDMGGWVELGQVETNELKFKANEFAKRYQGYRQKGAVEDYPAKLVGITEGDCASRGFDIPPPVLIGNTGKAMAVEEMGNLRPRLRITTATQAAVSALKQVEHKAVNE